MVEAPIAGAEANATVPSDLDRYVKLKAEVEANPADFNAYTGLIAASENLGDAES